MDLYDLSLFHPLAAEFGGPKEFLWWSQSQGEGQKLHVDKWEVLSDQRSSFAL